LDSFTELKQVIDSMESSIEKDLVNNFQRLLSIIGGQYSDKTEVTSIIKMMQALGKYLGSKKDNAHKDSIPVLKSFAHELKKLILNPDFTREQTNQIISGCIKNYKSLKSKITFQPLVSVKEIQDLKAVILAVDWEISDATMKTFDSVTTRLLNQLKSQKILHAFLRIIHSMGRYIASKKANAHKDSIFLLRSVFENFERVIQNPEMPFQEKKQLIESDVNAFHNFKREIASLKNNITTPTQETEDEIIQPALSHVKPSNKNAAQDVVPLRQLSQEETSMNGQSLDSEIIAPALAGGEKKSQAHRDIMDELFSVKETPADELLDAIHLAEIHGPDQQKDSNEPTKEELQRKGIKNFTPRRMDNEPIPEIENRLDEFFSLDISENKTTIKDNNLTLESDQKDPVHPSDDNSLEVIEPSEASEAIIPFQDEDESFQENPNEEDTALAAVNRLKTLVETHDGLLEDKSLTIMDKDLSKLKNLWQDDLDKTMLIGIISGLVLLLKNRSLPASQEIGAMESKEAQANSEQSIPDQSIPEEPVSEQSISDKLDTPPLSFWGKLKSIVSYKK